MAPYGNRNDDEVEKFEQLIRQELVNINDDGSIWLNQKYFNYATGLRMIHDKKWEKLFGMPKRDAKDELTQRHCNLALSNTEYYRRSCLPSWLKRPKN